MDRWKTEQTTLVGAAAILYALESAGYEIHTLEIIKSEGLAPLAGVEPGVGGQGSVVGRFTSFRVYIVARRRDDWEEGS